MGSPGLLHAASILMILCLELGTLEGSGFCPERGSGLVPHYKGLIDHTYYQYGLMDSYFIQ